MYALVLFSRCELVDLYGSISPYLSNKFKVIHLAYSIQESEILKNKYNIDEVIIFKDQISKILTDIQLNLQTLNEIDGIIIEQTDGRFCLNSAIHSDRGFSYLEYDEALLLCQAYYLFWKEFIINNNVKFILHEPTSLFFNHIAAILCKKDSGKYLCQIMVNSDVGYKFLWLSDDNSNAFELKEKYKKITPQEVDNKRSRIVDYITKFRGTDDIFLSNIIKYKIPYLKLIAAAVKSLAFKLIKSRKLNRIRDNTDYWILKSSQALRRIRNLLDYKIRLKYDEFAPSLHYYYYPFHLEPEAVVLYWGDGLYKGQVKLIENIASVLPPDTYLFIKDHPHHIGYRSVCDYLYLQKIPNIRLIAPNIPGKRVIKDALGIITINGSAGFEGILLNKPVYIFGNAYYEISNRVFKIENIKDLREVLYDNRHLYYNDDFELYKFVLSFLSSIHEGVVDFYANRIYKYQIDLTKNSKLVAESLNNIVNNLVDNDTI